MSNYTFFPAGIEEEWTTSPGLGRSQRRQHCLQQLPAMGDRFDLDPLARCMRTAYIGTERDHVQLRMTGCEQTALQPGMDHLQRGRLAELLCIDLLA